MEKIFKNMHSGLTNNQLKIIAMVSMLIDHTGMGIFPEHEIFRIMGRLAFPIFAYMIAEGCFYTKHKIKYLLMIAGLGIGCQVVYTIASHSLYQNILLTFTFSVITIFAIDNFLEKKNKISFLCMCGVIFSVVLISLVFPVIFKEKGFDIDYGFPGVLLPVAVYYSPTKKLKIISASAVLTGMAFLSGGIQFFSLFSVPLLMLYNGKRGKLNMKYVFYIFYPAHLAIIYMIGKII